MPGSGSLTVLSVAYPLAPVGAAAVGGAEEILSTLDRHLVRAGHWSIVIACEGSSAEGELHSTRLPAGLFEQNGREAVWREHRAAIQRVLERYSVALVHLHGLDGLQYLPSGSVPVLMTLHLPLSWYPAELFSLKRANLLLNCVSELQRRSMPEAASMAVVENGVDAQPRTMAHRRSICVAMGRICREKGCDIALRAARRAGRPLLLAGRVFPYPDHVAYFEREIQPLLDSSRRFIGPVNAAWRGRLLARASCVLIPSLAPETSSLVAMEAAMAGAPVIAFRSGALPDIVEHGRTGFLVNDEQEMAEAIALAGRIDSVECRRVAEERFSADAMCARYFELYRRMARGLGSDERAVA